MTALTPIARMLLSIIQMQFIFLNTTDLDMGRHKVVSRFGLMHMVATNLCEWLYVLVEETKHEIQHLNLLKSGKNIHLSSALWTLQDPFFNMDWTESLDLSSEYNNIVNNSFIKWIPEEWNGDLFAERSQRVGTFIDQTR